MVFPLIFKDQLESTRQEKKRMNGLKQFNPSYINILPALVVERNLFIYIAINKKSFDKRTKSHNDYIPNIDKSQYFYCPFGKDIKKKRKLFLGFKLMFQSSFINKLRCRLFFFKNFLLVFWYWNINQFPFLLFFLRYPNLLINALQLFFIIFRIRID